MKIGIVNDMALALEVLAQIVRRTPGYEVAWTARDGAEAVARCAELRPDLILMDLIMPVMDGVEATRRIMAESPCAILVVTATVEGNANRVFEAMGAGALDAINTPVVGLGGGIAGGEGLMRKIEQVGRLIDMGPGAEADPPHAEAAEKNPAGLPLVVIGASTGGPQAVATLLGALPKSFPAALVVAQHVDEVFAESLTGWWSRQSPLPVRCARMGDEVRAGEVLVAATNDHLVVHDDGTVGYTSFPKESAYRPSVDTLFKSVTRNWSGPGCGVLLTGMGRDGAEGLLALRRHGFLTIAQDEATSVVYGMPKAAVRLQAAEKILPLREIAPALIHYFQARQAR